MAFDASGIFTRLRGNDSWKGDATAGTKIRADLHDDNDNDIANSLSECITKTGKSQPLADIPWGGKKLTGLGPPTNPDDATNKAYVDALKTYATALTIAGSFPESVVKFTGSTGPWGDSYVTADLAYGVRGTDWVWNTKADFSGTDVMKLTEAGALTVAGQITGSTAIHSTTGYFIGPSSGNTVLASGLTNGTGNIYLRPNGQANSIGQTLVDANGAISCWGNVWAGTASAGTDFGLQIVGTARHFRFSGGYSWTEDSTSGNIHLYMAGGTKATFDLAANFTIYGAAYKPGGGSWSASSDARIKTVSGDYATGLEAVMALRPVRYVYKGNDTPEEPRSYSDPSSDPATRSTDAPTVPYPNSDHFIVAREGKEFVGFVAQEAETAMPDIVTTHAGFIDGVPVADIRDIDTSRLIYALVNAVKELSARIEALEAAA